MTQLRKAREDWSRYIEIYNRCMNFAPYSAPLTQRFIEAHVVQFMEENESCAWIAAEGNQEGILHVSLMKKENGAEGVVHLLLADTNDLAEKLLKKAEAWASERGANTMRSYQLFFNPYQYIQHGYEAYCWGGLYTARNAFARRKWDLDLDIVNMFLDMREEPEVFGTHIDGISIQECECQEDELQKSGKMRVEYKGDAVAFGGYILLKKVSESLGRKIGQIWLHAEERAYGKGFAKAAITACHKKLYQLGARRVILATNNALFRAIRFYYALGYRAEPIHAFMFSKEIKRTK